MQCRKSDTALSDIGMPVFGGSLFVFTVIDVEDTEPVFADQTVKSIDNAVKIMYNVVSCIVYMAGVETDAQLIRMYHAVINRREFLKAAADFGSLSRHGFQCDTAGGVCRQNGVQSFRNLPDPRLCTGAYMGAGMENQRPASHGGRPLDLQREKIDCQTEGIGVDCIGQIDDIGGVDDKFCDSGPGHQCLCFGNAQL